MSPRIDHGRSQTVSAKQLTVLKHSSRQRGPSVFAIDYCEALFPLHPLRNQRGQRSCSEMTWYAGNKSQSKFKNLMVLLASREDDHSLLSYIQLCYKGHNLDFPSQLLSLSHSILEYKFPYFTLYRFLLDVFYLYMIILAQQQVLIYKIKLLLLCNYFPILENSFFMRYTQFILCIIP